MERQIINCKEDKKFEQDRNLTHSCNSLFSLDESNIFYVESLYYGDEIIGQYYTICPNCGYIVMLDEEKLSLEQMKSAQKSYKEDYFQFKKNNLISQLINLESRSPKRGAKARVRTIY